mgnify:CR=1 FL=1
MIDYTFAQYLELLSKPGKKNPPPGLHTEYLPLDYRFKTQASLEKLEEIVLSNGFRLEHDVVPMFKIYQHESGLISGLIPFPELASYGETLIINKNKELEYKASLEAPAIIYNSCFKYETKGRNNTGKLEAVAKVTEGIMKALHAEQIPAFWMMRGARQLPVTASNSTEQRILH